MDNSMAMGMCVGMFLERWKSMYTRDEITEIENKYRLSIDNLDYKKMVSDRARQMHIGKAARLIEKIIEVDGPDITSMNFNNAMTYLLVALDSQKYLLDVKYARDDLCIEDMLKHYGLR